MSKCITSCMFAAIFICRISFADISDSAVLAWKFPVANGIVCEADKIVKWNVPDHLQLPTSEEIASWKQEYISQVQTKQIENAKLEALGKILAKLSQGSQDELIKALMVKATLEGVSE